MVMGGTKGPDWGTPVMISITRGQRELLLKEIPFPDHLLRLIRLATVERNHFRIRLTMEQLDEVLDYIEDHASETTNKKLQNQLYALCESMEQVGPRKIVDMERLQNGSAGSESEPAYSQDNATEPGPASHYVGGPKKFTADSGDPPPLPAEFHELFLNFLSHHGRIPRPEMSGVSWDQLIQLMRSDRDDDRGPIRFNRALSLQELRNAEKLHRARTFLSAVVESGGVKATVAGNLNRAFVGRMVGCMTWPDDYLEHLHEVNKVVNEQDVFPLHIVRILLEPSGLLVLRKGVFSASKKGETAPQRRSGGSALSCAIHDLVSAHEPFLP